MHNKQTTRMRTQNHNVQKHMLLHTGWLRWVMSQPPQEHLLPCLTPTWGGPAAPGYLNPPAAPGCIAQWCMLWSAVQGDARVTAAVQEALVCGSNIAVQGMVCGFMVCDLWCALCLGVECM